ncbi:MAG: Stk1 family PASTA domain-containing Ser/Thr kinase [Microbacterium sp.]
MSTSQQADPLVGQLVDGRYRVRSRIARGGMATVYVATDLRLERRVALKVMHAHLSDDSVFQSRFIQEARSAARLADPHVVNVFDQGQDGELAYLVMEYLPGITLRDLLKEQKRLSVTQTITVLDAILSGLSAAHGAGLIHRDVKPENVLLAEDGRIKVGDFGLARATSANTATGAQLLGTIAYLAPELVTRGTADARSDIYALGIMLYEMLTGVQPFRGEQPMQIAYQHATDSVPRPSAKNPAVPEQLDELVLWATEKEPDERPEHAGEMLERVREIERQLGVSPLAASGAALPVTEALAEPIDTDEQTKIMPFSRTDVVTAEIDDPTPRSFPEENSVRLRRVTERRSRRGFWLVALVLVLSLAAGGAGWFWGTGPGSQVAVPDVSGGTFDEAKAALAEQGLVAVENGVHSLEVDAGVVVDTDPSPGAAVDKDSTVTVNVSSGPAEVEVPALPGTSEEDATDQLAELGVEVAEVRKYFLDATAGNVTNVRIQPRDGGDVAMCTDGCTAHDGDTAILSVSLGAVPDVTEASIADATSRLEGAGLTVAGETQRQYDDGIAENRVIGIVPKGGDGVFAEGDQVTLIESLGPQPVAIPDVEGMTRDEAVDALQEAGFEVEFNQLWRAWPNEWTTITGTDPEIGSEHVPEKTSVTLSIDNTGSV